MNKFLTFITFIILITSCKSISKIGKRDPSVNLDDYIEARISNRHQENFLSDQVDISIDDGEQQNAKAKVYVSSGNLIFISVNFLGFEIARAQLTRDSLKFINRVGKEYYFGKLDYLQKLSGINLTYDEIESLLIMGFPVLNDDNKETIKQRFSDAGSEYIYTYIADRRTVNVYFTKNPIHQYKIEISDPGSALKTVLLLEDYLQIPFYPGTLKGSFIRRNNVTNVRISINKIENKVFQNNSFKVNNNYNAVGQ